MNSTLLNQIENKSRPSILLITDDAQIEYPFLLTEKQARLRAVSDFAEVNDDSGLNNAVDFTHGSVRFVVIFPTTNMTHPLSLSFSSILPIEVSTLMNYRFAFSLDSCSCSVKHADSAVFLGVKGEDQTRRKQREINAILSLDRSRVYTMASH